MGNLADHGNMPEILAIEKVIKQFEQIDCPLQHFLIPGVYVRVMHIPADTLLTGHIHNEQNIAILAQGRIRIADGDRAYIIEAPFIQIDKPGVKRLGYAETDCTFLTVHRVPEHESDIEVLEDLLVSKDFDEYERTLEFKRQQNAGRLTL